MDTESPSSPHMASAAGSSVCGGSLEAVVMTTPPGKSAAMFPVLFDTRKQTGHRSGRMALEFDRAHPRACTIVIYNFSSSVLQYQFSAPSVESPLHSSVALSQRWSGSVRVSSSGVGVSFPVNVLPNPAANHQAAGETLKLLIREQAPTSQLILEYEIVVSFLSSSSLSDSSSNTATSTSTFSSTSSSNPTFSSAHSSTHSSTSSFPSSSTSRNSPTTDSSSSSSSIGGEQIKEKEELKSWWELSPVDENRMTKEDRRRELLSAENSYSGTSIGLLMPTILGLFCLSVLIPNGESLLESARLWTAFFFGLVAMLFQQKLIAYSHREAPKQN